MHPSESKQLLRQSIEERLSHMPPVDRQRESRSICRRLEPLIPSGSVICAYSALPSEVDLTPLITLLLTRGDRVFFPCVENRTLFFRRVKDLQDLQPGPYGILEPSKESELLDPQSLSIALIPGRAFDRDGNRLGRGNGGYDHWICVQRALNPKTKYWGVAWECQIVDSVPAEGHDERMHAIVTARGFQEVS